MRRSAASAEPTRQVEKSRRRLVSQLHSVLQSVPLGRSVHGPVTCQLPVPMTLSTFLPGVEASHLAGCRGSCLYLVFYLAITTNVPRFHLRRDGHVQFPNRLPLRIGSKREEFSTSGKYEVRWICWKASSGVSYTQNVMVCVGARILRFSHCPSPRFGWHRRLGNCQHQASSGSLRRSCLSVSCSFENQVLVQHHQLRYWIGRTFSFSDAHAVCFSRCCRAGFKADNNDVCFFQKSSILAVASLQSLCCYWSQRDRAPSGRLQNLGCARAFVPS